LPITALRVTPPSSLAIWLADWPSAHMRLSVSTRSSVQDICLSGFPMLARILSGLGIGPQGGIASGGEAIARLPAQACFSPVAAPRFSRA
jgi:hypothetical protein